MSTALLRKLQTAISASRLTSSLPQVNVAVGVQVGVDHPHDDAGRVERDIATLDAGVPKAVHGVPRLEHLAGGSGRDHLIALYERDRRRA
ncbi:hypothetical protein [Actinoplanes couchii]|uniref:Uncharacterized protein n=1 Tax=Actinoplanes couchii TaxID=403638 RepID=A0ABQ3XSW1_9ACTN|nr:hypothetical protein [Actinoplanes couchii]MDR6324072.1 hypothetical protein [Actinoplanes couchii]GID61599.1 hypothetical protein Aco03nite_100030 [Actinoplanes couchii]